MQYKNKKRFILWLWNANEYLILCLVKNKKSVFLLFVRYWSVWKSSVLLRIEFSSDDTSYNISTYSVCHRWISWWNFYMRTCSRTIRSFMEIIRGIKFFASAFIVPRPISLWLYVLTLGRTFILGSYSYRPSSYFFFYIFPTSEVYTCLHSPYIETTLDIFLFLLHIFLWIFLSKSYSYQ